MLSGDSEDSSKTAQDVEIHTTTILLHPESDSQRLVW
jgi:hypothetical protein